MFFKILAALALISLLILAAFKVLNWENVLFLIGILASYILGEKIGKRQTKDKNT